MPKKKKWTYGIDDFGKKFRFTEDFEWEYITEKKKKKKR
jgi:hypothetical protein